MQNPPYGPESRVLAAILKNLRANIGMTPVEMAEPRQDAPRCARATYPKIENGVRRINESELRRRLAVLNLDNSNARSVVRRPLPTQFDSVMQDAIKVER
jgi:hypothetical protein